MTADAFELYPDAGIDPQFANYLREPPRLSYSEPNDPWLSQFLVTAMENLLGRRKLEAIYFALKAADISVAYDQAKLQSIPRSGPLVFVANHPYGIIDGLILCDLALKARNDMRIMLHSLLCQDRQFANYFLPIDFTESREAVKTNIRSKQLALDYLRRDIPVLIFPSGMVSTAGRGGFGEVKDGAWTTFAAKIIREANATVIPCYFHGRNSRPFHVLSNIAQPLRTALLLHEAANKFGQEVKLEIGDPLPWQEISHHAGRAELTSFLYQQVQKLGENGIEMNSAAAAD